MIREADNIMTLIILCRIKVSIKHLTHILSIITKDNQISIRLFIHFNLVIFLICKILTDHNFLKISVKMPINMIIFQWVISNFNSNFKTKFKIEASRFTIQTIIFSKKILFIKNIVCLTKTISM
jgi:hypothetical protein